MAKKTIIMSDNLNKAINDYRKAHPKNDGDLQSYTWAAIQLLMKGLEAEGIQVEEESP